MDLYPGLGRALAPPGGRGGGRAAPLLPPDSAAARVAALAADVAALRGAKGSASTASSLPLGAAVAAATARLASAAEADGRLPARLPHAIHPVATSNGSPYLNVQTRIMYATYTKVASGPGGEGMAGFTRILHRSADDELSPSVPTFRVAPATPACDGWCEFPVADRPAAVGAWLAAVRRGEARVGGRWVYLIETDYLWIAPLAPPAPSTAAGTVFPFGYITPAHPDAAPCVRRLLPDGVSLDAVPGTGPAPALLTLDDWAAIVPGWTAAAAAVEGDEEARAVLGWVREMYAFSIALAAARLDHPPSLPAPPDSPLIAQPPADDAPGNASALHYTWGTKIVRPRRQGEETSKDDAASDTASDSITVWEFDKRRWTDAALVGAPPSLPAVPAWEAEWTLPDGAPVTRRLRDTLALEAAALNEAVAGLGRL